MKEHSTTCSTISSEYNKYYNNNIYTQDIDGKIEVDEKPIEWRNEIE